MFSESIMSYTYDETEALRHSFVLGAFARFWRFLAVIFLSKRLVVDGVFRYFGF